MSERAQNLKGNWQGYVAISFELGAGELSEVRTFVEKYRGELDVTHGALGSNRHTCTVDGPHAEQVLEVLRPFQRARARLSCRGIVLLQLLRSGTRCYLGSFPKITGDELEGLVRSEGVSEEVAAWILTGAPIGGSVPEGFVQRLIQTAWGGPPLAESPATKGAHEVPC